MDVGGPFVLDALAADGQYPSSRQSRPPSYFGWTFSPSVFRDALSACDSRASLTYEVEGQSGDIRIDRAGEQSDLIGDKPSYLYVRGECDVVSCGAVRKQNTHGAPYITDISTCPAIREAPAPFRLDYFHPSLLPFHTALLAMPITDEQSLASEQSRNLCAVVRCSVNGENKISVFRTTSI